MNGNQDPGKKDLLKELQEAQNEVKVADEALFSRLRNARRELVKEKRGAVGRLIEPPVGGIGEKITAATDYALNTLAFLAEKPIDTLLTLGTETGNLAKQIMPQGRMMPPSYYDWPSFADKPMAAPSVRETMDWMTDGEYSQQQDAAFRAFEEGGRVLRGTREVVGSVLQFYAMFSRGLLGMPGGIMRAVSEPVAQSMAGPIGKALTQIAVRVGMPVEKFNSAIAAGTLHRDLLKHMPNLRSKLGTWITANAPQIAGTAAGLGTMNMMMSPGTPEERSTEYAWSLVSAPFFVGIGQIANKIERAIGTADEATAVSIREFLTGKAKWNDAFAPWIAGAVEGLGFETAMSPRETADFMRSLLQGDQEKIYAHTVRILGGVGGMAAIRGVGAADRDVWRREFPQDRVRQFPDLPNVSPTLSNLQLQGWRAGGDPKNARLRLPGTDLAIEISEGEGGRPVVRATGDWKSVGREPSAEVMRGEEADRFLRDLDALTAVDNLESLSIQEFPRMYEMTPGVLRHPTEPIEYTFRFGKAYTRVIDRESAPWRAIDLTDAGLHKRGRRDLPPTLEEMAGDLDALARQLHDSDSSFAHVRLAKALAEYVRSSLVDDPAIVEGHAAMRDVRAESEVRGLEDRVRALARILGGNSNLEAEGFVRPPQPKPTERVEPREEPPRSQQILEQVKGRRPTTMRRAERREMMRTYVQEAMREGRQIKASELAREFGVSTKTAATRIREARTRAPKMAVEPEGRPASLRAAEVAMTPEAQVEPRPIRESDFLRAARGSGEDPIKVGIRQNRKLPKGVVAFYDNLKRMIGIRHSPRLVATAHEFAHAMKAKYAPDWVPTDVELLNDLAKVAAGYPGLADMPRPAQVGEGWAEYWARHMIGDTTLAQEVPTLHRYMQDWMATQTKPLRRQVERLTDIGSTWVKMGAIGRMKGTVEQTEDRPTAEEIRSEPSGWKRFFRQIEGALIDDLAPIKRRIKEFQKRAEMDPEALSILSDPGRLMEIIRMQATATADRFVKAGTYNLKGEKTGPSLQEVFRELETNEVSDWVLYAVARRSLEAIEKGMPTQLPKSDYEHVVKQLENERFKKITDEVTQFSHRVVDYAVEAGAMAPELAKAIKEAWDVYIPMQRIVDDLIEGRGGAGRGRPLGDASVIDRMKGSAREIKDPIEALFSNVRRLIVGSHQALVQKSFVRFALEHPEASDMVQQVARDVDAKTYSLEQVRSSMRRAGKKKAEQQKTEDFDPELGYILDRLGAYIKKHRTDDFGVEALTLFSPMIQPLGSKPVVAITPRFSDAELATMPEGARKRAEQINGKTTWWELDKQLYEALSTIDALPYLGKEAPAAIRAVLTIPTVIAKIGITGLSPAFVLRNIIRDIASFTFYESSGRLAPWRGISAFIKHAKELRAGSHDAELFYAQGGGMANLVTTELTPKMRRAVIVDKYDSPWHALQIIGSKLIEWMAAPEKVLRFAAFKEAYHKARAEGKPELEALLTGKEAGNEITVNFLRAGTAGRALNRIKPYFNPNIQGQRKLYRRLLGYDGKRAQKLAVANGIASLSTMSIITWLLYRDEEWYQDRPEWEKMNYWPIEIGGVHMRIPKPFEAGKLFTIPVEMALESWSKSNPVEAADFAADWAKGFIGDWAFFIPHAVLPAVETVANYSFFQGRSIVPEYILESREPAEQYTRYTSGIAKLIGGALNVSPAKLEHLVRGYTGGLGTKLMGMIDEAKNWAAEKDVDVRQIPALGTLFAPPHRGSRMVNDLYEERLRLRRIGDKSRSQRAQLRVINRAADDIRDLRDRRDKGEIGLNEANRLMFEVARDAMVMARER